MFRFCIPSWVAFTDDGAALVGEAAMNQAQADPEAAIFGFKRLLGLRRNRIYHEDMIQAVIKRVPYKIGARGGEAAIEVKAEDGAVKQLDITKIASMVVSELKKKAEEHLGHKVWYAVVTVPQHFHQASTEAAMAAGRSAGLDIDDGTVSEPVAAAAAYGLHRKLREDGNALVLHVGGGTAYASVVTMMDGDLEVWGYWDEPFLGGDNFDQRIVDHFVRLIRTKHGKDIREDGIALRRLRMACERAKKTLSSQDHVQVTVESLFDDMDFSEALSRSEFEELNDDLFHKFIAMVERVMVETKNMIDEIVLVGGSTMIPKIQKLVKDYFDGKEPNYNITVKPDEAVTIGAAVLIHSLD
ncbi:hypothetical protein ACP70R_020462 [Stipagrostis hirtigluma subsp. patula]